MSNPCDRAHPGLSAAEMAQLIKECPPGPWPSGWAGWDNVRQAHIQLMDEAIANCPPYPGHFQGRGIVSCVSAKPGLSSGKNLPHGYFPGAWCMLKELRRHGCTLPVLFCHLGALEWDQRLTRLVKPLGVEVLDLLEENEKDPMRILAGWEAKVYSIIRAPFKEVLYLDADNLPLRDPTFLFDSSQYKFHGAVFWPDVPPYDRDCWLPEAVWKQMDMPTLDVQAAESGQILIDKERCWPELCLTRWINEHSDRFYHIIFGDKDSFVLGWEKLAHREVQRHKQNNVERGTFRS